VTALDDLNRAEYPRTNKYDARWLISLDMGPNSVWLLEDLSRDLDLRPGVRMLDLGSGRGATSVFLAREFGVEVWAADLSVPPDVAAAVFEAEGVRNRVHHQGERSRPAVCA
jgi:cyclopropane fatty-acyl-phospholipid synthase-like methyltransferase